MPRKKAAKTKTDSERVPGDFYVVTVTVTMERRVRLLAESTEQAKELVKAAAPKIVGQELSRVGGTTYSAKKDADQSERDPATLNSPLPSHR